MSKAARPVRISPKGRYVTVDIIKLAAAVKNGTLAEGDRRIAERILGGKFVKDLERKP